MSRRRAARTADVSESPASENWLALADAAREADQSPDPVRWAVLAVTVVLTVAALAGVWWLVQSF